MPTDSPAASQDQSPQSLADALRQEFEEIDGHPAKPDGRPTLDDTFGIDQSALCLSGGGIRSGAFALGVIQALARKELLTGIHYLSTVSGGGYTGAWLTALIHRQDGDVKAVQERLAKVRDEEDIAIRRLRMRTNYLNPSKTPLSIDTLTAIVTIVRNLLLNWLLFIPLVWIVVLVMKLLPVTTVGVIAIATFFAPASIIIAGALSLFVTFAVYCAMPGRKWDPKDRMIALSIVIPTLLWALVLSWGVAAAVADHWTFRVIWDFDIPLPVLGSWVGTLIGYGLGMIRTGKVVQVKQPGRNLVAWVGASLAVKWPPW